MESSDPLVIVTSCLRAANIVYELPRYSGAARIALERAFGLASITCRFGGLPVECLEEAQCRAGARSMLEDDVRSGVPVNPQAPGSRGEDEPGSADCGIGRVAMIRPALRRPAPPPA